MMRRVKKYSPPTASEVTVITAVIGDFDEIPPVPAGFEKAVLVSDVPDHSDWTNVVMPTTLTPRLASKIPKSRPDLFTTTSASVWIDASMRDPMAWLFSASLEAMSRDTLVVFKHPDRKNLLDEVKA
jgi:hypothetical protein